MKKNLLTITGIYLLFTSLYFTAIWISAFTLNDKGDLVAGAITLWGDGPAHFTMGSAMAYRRLFLFTSPFLIDAPFIYPFVANLLSALLIRAGMPFIAAFSVPSFLCSLAVVISLFAFYKLAFRQVKIAVLSSSLFFLNGGTGFFAYFKDVTMSDRWLTALVNPPQRYTHLDESKWAWYSVIESMILPQRAFQLGFPVALLALMLMWTALIDTSSESDKKWRRPVLTAGILIGLLPVVHTHSFLAVCAILACWLLKDALFAESRRKSLLRWMTFALTTAAVALPLLSFFIFSRLPEGKYLKWTPGWMSPGFGWEWIHFWFRNWGFTPLLGLLGWIALIKNQGSSLDKKKACFTFLPFFLLFALVNLILFQPWKWDNTKILVWASVGISGLAGYFICSLWEKPGKEKEALHGYSPS